MLPHHQLFPATHTHQPAVKDLKNRFFWKRVVHGHKLLPLQGSNQTGTWTADKGTTDYTCPEACQCSVRKTTNRGAGLLNQYQAIGHSILHNPEKWSAGTYVAESDDLPKVMTKLPDSSNNKPHPCFEGFFHTINLDSPPAEYSDLNTCRATQIRSRLYTLVETGGGTIEVPLDDKVPSDKVLGLLDFAIHKLLRMQASYQQVHLQILAGPYMTSTWSKSVCSSLPHKKGDFDDVKTVQEEMRQLISRTDKYKEAGLVGSNISQLADAQMLESRVSKKLNQILNIANRKEGAKKAAASKGKTTVDCGPMPPKATGSGMCYSFFAPTEVKSCLQWVASEEEVDDNNNQRDSPAHSSLLGGTNEAAGMEQQQQQRQQSPAVPVHCSLAPRMAGSEAAALDITLQVSAVAIQHQAAQLVMSMTGYSDRQQYMGQIKLMHIYSFSKSEPVRTSGLIAGCEEDVELVAAHGVCEDYIDPECIWAECDQHPGGPNAALAQFQQSLRLCAERGSLAAGDVSRLCENARTDTFECLDATVQQQRQRPSSHSLVTRANSDILELEQARQKRLRSAEFHKRYPLVEPVEGAIRTGECCFQELAAASSSLQHGVKTLDSIRTRTVLQETEVQRLHREVAAALLQAKAYKEHCQAVYTDDITAAAQWRKKLAQSSFLPHITDCVSQPATQIEWGPAPRMDKGFRMLKQGTLVIAGIRDVEFPYLHDSFKTSERCLTNMEQSPTGGLFMEDLSNLLGRCKLAYEASVDDDGGPGQASADASSGREEFSLLWKQQFDECNRSLLLLADHRQKKRGKADPLQVADDDDDDSKMSSIRLRTVRHAFDVVAWLSEDQCLQLTEFLDHLGRPVDPMQVDDGPPEVATGNTKTTALMAAEGQQPVQAESRQTAHDKPQSAKETLTNLQAAGDRSNSQQQHDNSKNAAETALANSSDPAGASDNQQQQGRQVEFESLPVLLMVDKALTDAGEQKPSTVQSITDSFKAVIHGHMDSGISTLLSSLPQLEHSQWMNDELMHVAFETTCKLLEPAGYDTAAFRDVCFLGPYASRIIIRQGGRPCPLSTRKLCRLLQQHNMSVGIFGDDKHWRVFVGDMSRHIDVQVIDSLGPAVQRRMGGAWAGSLVQWGKPSAGSADAEEEFGLDAEVSAMPDCSSFEEQDESNNSGCVIVE
eukprot:gene3167-3445_t